MATPLHPRLRPKSCWPVLLCLAPGLRLTFHGCAADGQPYDRQGGTDSAPGGHDAAAACAPHSQSPAPAFLNEATRLSFSFSSIPLAAPLQLRRAGPHCGGGSAPLRPLFPRSTGSRHTGPSGCSSRASGPGAPAQGLRRGLSCSTACAVFPDQGSPRVPCWQAGPCPLLHQGRLWLSVLLCPATHVEGAQASGRTGGATP